MEGTYAEEETMMTKRRRKEGDERTTTLFARTHSRSEGREQR
jgi:hypothetical protein